MLPSNKQPLNLKEQTQKALKTINQYERVKKIQMITTIHKIKSESNIGVLIRQFGVNQRVRLQLLSNYIAYYQLFINPKVDNKIIIRHFRGGPVQLYIFYNKLAKDLTNSSHRFTLKNQIILIMQKGMFLQAKSIILVFKNDRNMSILTFRIDSIQQKKKKRQLKTDRSIDSIKSIQLENINNQPKLMRSKSSRKKINKNQIDLNDLIRLRPQQRIKKIQQLKNIQIQKHEAAKKRIQNIQINKQLSAQALRVSSYCKKIFYTYQSLIQQQKNKKQQIIKNYAKLFYVLKFCKISSIFYHETEQKRKRVFMIKNYEKKFIKKIRRAYFETKRLQPDNTQRELESVCQYSSLFGHILNKYNNKKAQNVVKDVLEKCLPGITINLAMGQASNYRRIIRTLQRRWKIKFQSRTQMLLLYAQEQLRIIIKNYPYLTHVEKEYLQNQRARALCLQYQRQTAAKMVQFISAYRMKLQQIAEYQRINEQIIQFNKTALKKRQKDLLQIQKKPAFPSFRFFRDLQFFKSMIRGQLQLQFRRFKKKNPQMFTEEKPVEKQKSKTNKKTKQLK